MLLSFVLLLLAGFVLTDTRVHSKTWQANDGNHGHGKIINGTQVRPNTYPFMAWLVITFRDRDYSCAGALINKHYVLTAAHCLVMNDGEEATEILVLLGAHNISKNKEPYRASFTASSFITADYDVKTHFNDVALIHLDYPVTFSRQIKPICLALPGSIHRDQIATVAGWGATSYGASSSDVLMHVQVPVLSDKVCRGAYGGALYYDELMICAGYMDGGKDSCQDSGGPLFLKNNHGFTAIGVVSFSECAEPGYPGVYAEVQHYTRWIQQNSAAGGSVCTF